jgi:hypothetical protein
MVKFLSEMTRVDWLTRRWLNTTPPGSKEMMFTDAGGFPPAQRTALLDVLYARLAMGGSRDAAKSDEPVAR